MIVSDRNGAAGHRVVKVVLDLQTASALSPLMKILKTMTKSWDLSMMISMWSTTSATTCLRNRLVGIPKPDIPDEPVVAKVVLAETMNVDRGGVTVTLLRMMPRLHDAVVDAGSVNE
jgi:hypothetical protein